MPPPQSSLDLLKKKFEKFPAFASRLASVWGDPTAVLGPLRLPQGSSAEEEQAFADHVKALATLKSLAPPGWGGGIVDERSAAAKTMAFLESMRGNPAAERAYNDLAAAAPGFWHGLARGAGAPGGWGGDVTLPTEQWGEILGRLGGNIGGLTVGALVGGLPGATLMSAGGAAASDYLSDTPSFQARGRADLQASDAYDALMTRARSRLDPEYATILAREGALRADRSQNVGIPTEAQRVRSALLNAGLDAATTYALIPGASQVSALIKQIPARLGRLGRPLATPAAIAGKFVQAATAPVAQTYLGGKIVENTVEGIDPFTPENLTTYAGLGAPFVLMGLRQPVQPYTRGGGWKGFKTDFGNRLYGPVDQRKPSLARQGYDAALAKLFPQQAEAAPAAKPAAPPSSAGRAVDLPIAAAEALQGGQRVGAIDRTSVKAGFQRATLQNLAEWMQANPNAIDIFDAPNPVWIPGTDPSGTGGQRAWVVGQLAERQRPKLFDEGLGEYIETPDVLVKHEDGTFSLQTQGTIDAWWRSMPLNNELAQLMDTVIFPPGVSKVPGGWGRGLPVTVGGESGLAAGLEKKTGLVLVQLPDGRSKLVPPSEVPEFDAWKAKLAAEVAARRARGTGPPIGGATYDVDRPSLPLPSSDIVGPALSNIQRILQGEAPAKPPSITARWVVDKLKGVGFQDMTAQEAKEIARHLRAIQKQHGGDPDAVFTRWWDAVQ